MAKRNGNCDRWGRLLRQIGRVGATDWENAQKGRGDVGFSGVENEGEKSKLRQIWEKIRG